MLSQTAQLLRAGRLIPAVWLDNVKHFIFNLFSILGYILARIDYTIS